MSVGTGHAAAEPEPTPEKSPGSGRKWKLALVGLFGIYVLLAAYGLVVNSSEFSANTASLAATTSPSAADQASTGSPSAAAPAGKGSAPVVSRAGSSAPHSLSVVSIAAFGPDGTSDGDNPALASHILDVSTDQPWYSQWYATPKFGDLRSGTGLLLDMGETVTVSDVQLVLGSEQGADVQVRVGNSPSLDLPTMASASGIGGDVRLTAATPAKGRYVLIWFTQLPPDGHGHYQISVYTATVDGAGGP